MPAPPPCRTSPGFRCCPFCWRRLTSRASAQALGDAESAIKHGPVSWHKGHYRKAMAQLETLNYEEAVRSFAAAAERAPDETIRQDALNFLRKVRLPKPSACASN